MKKIMLYIKPYFLWIIVTLILAAITVSTTLYLPILAGKAVDFLIGTGQVNFKGIKSILYKMVLFVMMTSISQWLMNISNNHITYHVVQDIRRDAMNHIQALPVKYLDGHSTGDIVSRMIADVDQLADGLLMGFTQAFTGILTIVGTLLFMIHVNIWISLVVILLTPLSFVVAAFIASRTHHMFQLQSETRGEQTAFLEEKIDALRLMSAYGRQSQTLAEFDEINERLGKYSMKATFYSSTTNPSTRCVNNLVYAGVGIVGAFFVLQGRMTVGQLSCFLTYANQYTKPFNEISGVITELQNAVACAERIFQLMEEKTEKPDEAQSFISSCRGDIEFCHVYFSYEKQKPFITDFNLEAKAGQRIAIVGPTGCGKTTLINLLLRFYDVDKGCVKMDGIDIRYLERKNLRNQIGMVLQDTWLMDGTIRDNIAMGKPGATQQEIEQVAKSAHIHHFIEQLPAGYETMVSESGDAFSQGQKQLICIARVMLCHPPLLILDEATSSIDTYTEIQVQEVFDQLMRGRTSFIVAHRLSTIRNADQILVMKEGKIMEQGNFETLLQRDGFFAKLYYSQFNTASE